MKRFTSIIFMCMLFCFGMVNAQDFDLVINYPMSSDSRVVSTDDPYYFEDKNEVTGYKYAVKDADVYYPAFYPSGCGYAAIRVSVEEPGTYKFSFRHFQLSEFTGFDDDLSARLYYTKGDLNSEKIYVKDAISVPAKYNPADEIISDEFEISEAGDYYFTYEVTLNSGEYSENFVLLGDFNLYKEGEPGIPSVDYAEPEYKCDAGNEFDAAKFKDTYVKTITLTNGGQNKEWNYEAPRKFWNVLSDMTMKANPGETISAHLVANSLGDYNTGTVLQDLRFTAVVLAIDWDGDGTFEYAEKIKGNTPPTHNVGGNADPSDTNGYVMDFTYDINVPVDAKTGMARIRFNYTNAWFGDSTAKDFVMTCKEGIVYDFDVVIGEIQEYPIKVTYDENIESVVLKKGNEIYEDSLAYNGTELSVEVVAKDGYRLKSIMVNDNDITSEKKFTVKGETNIVVSSEEIPSYVVSLEENEAIDSIVLKDSSDNVVEFGSSVREGTELFVELALKENYALKSLNANDQNITQSKSFVVTEAVTITVEARKVEFVTVSYSVVGNENNARIEITNENAEVLPSPAKIEKGTTYSIAVYPSEEVLKVEVKLNSDVVELEYDSDLKVYYYVADATEDHEYVIILDDGSGVSKVEAEKVLYDSELQTITTDGSMTVVYDMMGCMVLDSNKKTFSISSLPDGIYTVVSGKTVLKIRK